MPYPSPRPRTPRGVRTLLLGIVLAALLAGCAGTSDPTSVAADTRTVNVTLCFGTASDAAVGGRCSDASLTVALPTD